MKLYKKILAFFQRLIPVHRYTFCHATCVHELQITIVQYKKKVETYRHILSLISKQKEEFTFEEAEALYIIVSNMIIKFGLKRCCNSILKDLLFSREHAQIALKGGTLQCELDI